MELDYIQKLIEILDRSNVMEFELENEEGRIKIDLRRGAVGSAPTQIVQRGIVGLEVSQIADGNVDNGKDVKTAVARTVQEKSEIQSHGNTVKSPIVGIFYDTPSPDAEPFVKVGQRIKKGDTLCIIEAMKVMNEIESEFEGEILEILCKKGTMVEYNQPIMVIG